MAHGRRAILRGAVKLSSFLSILHMTSFCSTFCSNTYEEFEETCFGGPCINLFIYIYRPRGGGTDFSDPKQSLPPSLTPQPVQPRRERGKRTRKHRKSQPNPRTIPLRVLPREHLSLGQKTVDPRLLPHGASK